VVQHCPSATEIIVVDDGSNDGTSAWVRATHPSVRLVCLEKSGGFCRAINAGIAVAQAPVIETLNNDTFVTKNWAEKALELFADPTVGSVAPQVWLMDRPGLLDSAGDKYNWCGHAINRGHGEALRPSLNKVAEVFGASASAAFYRREALIAVGSFPEYFHAYYDDVDVAFRLRWAGYRCLYTPFSKIFHRLHGSYDHALPSTIFLMARNEERVFWTNVPLGLLAFAAAPHMAYVTACALAKLMKRRNFRAYFQGKLACLRELTEICRRRQWLSRLGEQAPFPVRHPVDLSPRPFAQMMFSTLRQLLRKPAAASKASPRIEPNATGLPITRRNRAA
jgi:GT2 family glycosyltransferase